MSYEYITGMGTETQQNGAATANGEAANDTTALLEPTTNGPAQKQIMTYQYLQAVEAVRTDEEGAKERLQDLLSQPYTVQTLLTCSAFDSGERAPSFATPEDQMRYQQLCMAAKMAQETAAGKDPMRETLISAMKVGAIFGAIGTVAAGFIVHRLYKKYKKFKEVISEAPKEKE